MFEQTGLACPKCPSSDAYAIDKNGWGHCFSCGVNIPPKNSEQRKTDMVEPTSKPATKLTPLANTFKPFVQRGFTEETMRKFSVSVQDDKVFYPLFDPNSGEHIANKVRRPDKKFLVEGDLSSSGLFGRHAFDPGSAKYITVTEGQDDALAVFQMTGSKWPVVSVSSAATALKNVQRDFEYLNSFDNIVFCFDNDEAGKKAVKQCAAAGFPLQKVKILNLRKHKDANDYLIKKDGDTFIREWWSAPTYKPDGLKLGKDMFAETMERNSSFSVPYPDAMSGLNEMTYGIRLSEAVIVTADTGVGKTSFLKTIEHSLLTNPVVKEKGYGVGFLHLEEPNGDTCLGLLSIHNGVPYHLPDVERPEEDMRRAFEEVLDNDRVVIWDHFGSNTVDAVLDKVRHMNALGCKYIVLDHLSIIVSDQSGDERKQLDEISTKLKTLAMELDIAIIAVIHTNRQGQIRGTAGVEQLANIIIRLERNKVDECPWRRNITKVTVEKNRFSGDTGPACYLHYSKETARLSSLSEEEVQQFVNNEAADVREW